MSCGRTQEWLAQNYRESHDFGWRCTLARRDKQQACGLSLDEHTLASVLLALFLTTFFAFCACVF